MNILRNMTNNNSIFTLRISANSITIAQPGNPPSGETVMGKGVAAALLVRQALDHPLLTQAANVRVMVDTPVLLLPQGEHDEEEQGILFDYTFSAHQHDTKLTTVIDDMQCVAVWPLKHEVKGAIDNRFAHAQYMPAALPVWRTLHHHARSSKEHRLYVYGHDQKIDVLCFMHNRIRFSNTFSAEHAHDALYYILYVWRQLAMHDERDQLWLYGTLPHEEWLLPRLRHHLPQVQMLARNEGLRHPQWADMASLPIDIITLLDQD